MTDTHDTNLPEKPVELEEEKKAAEVSEPATTETPGGCRRGERGKT